jgi:exosortase/archaeosortase family protein
MVRSESRKSAERQKPYETRKAIPRPVKLFLLKAIVLLVAWKALYLLVLQPGRILDKPLSYAVSAGTVATLNGFGHSKEYTTVSGVHPKGNPAPGDVVVWEPVMNIWLHNDRVLSIADACNGLELMVLYAGLILCLPSSWRRKLAYILCGMLLIQVLNVIRCAGLVLIYLHRPQYLDFSHHYLFSFLVYAFIFWLWFLFSNGPGFAKKLQLNATIS